MLLFLVLAVSVLAVPMFVSPIRAPGHRQQHAKQPVKGVLVTLLDGIRLSNILQRRV